MKLLQGNIYSGNRRLRRDLALIEDQVRPDVVTLNEGINAVPVIRRHMTTYRCLVNPDRGRGEWDTPILVRRGVKVGWWKSTQATKAVRPFKIAPARYLHEAVIHEHGEVWHVFNVHLNAALQSRRTGRPLRGVARVYQAGRHMRLLQRRARRAQRRGRQVVIGGDFNYRDRPGTRADTAWWWSPQRLFRRLNLNHWAVGLDYVAWPRTCALRRHWVIGKERTGSDHDWLLVDVVRRRR